MFTINVMDPTAVAAFISSGKRPVIGSRSGKAITANAAEGWQPIVNDEDLFVTNSILDKREWATLDAAVMSMPRLRTGGVADLRSRGLVRSATLATWLSQWRVGSERTAASVTMDGRSQVNLDRVDKKTYSVPLPIISADYRIGRRELLSSRQLGTGVDTTEAEEAAQAVLEGAETLLFSGNATVVVDAATIYGYTTLSGRDTATAAAYGGGDFATVTNVVPTFAGMIAALAAKRYHGPFACYVSPTQYGQMSTNFFTDGSGQTPLQRVLSLPQIASVMPGDFLTAGDAIMVQMTSNVVDMVEAVGLTNMQWTSEDGEELRFRVLMSITPRLKTDYAGYAGIAHATSC